MHLNTCFVLGGPQERNADNDSDGVKRNDTYVCVCVGRIISASNSVALECNIINYPTNLDNPKI